MRVRCAAGIGGSHIIAPACGESRAAEIRAWKLFRMGCSGVGLQLMSTPFVSGHHGQRMSQRPESFLAETANRRAKDVATGRPSYGVFAISRTHISVECVSWVMPLAGVGTGCFRE